MRLPPSSHFNARGYTKPCEVCGEHFRVRPSDVRKAASRGNGPPRFCGMPCRSVAYRGAGNPKWRGGLVPQPSGYVYAYQPNHPYATQDGYVMEHRLVMEGLVGRYLRPEEQVHHVNHIRNDNRPENLRLMANVVEHREMHAYYQDEQCGVCGGTFKTSLARRRRSANRFCSRRCAAKHGSNMAKERRAG